MKYKFLLFVFICTFSNAWSQCSFTPTVSGDLLLCPNETGTLTTQTYDTYQWYKRDFFGSPAAAIPGATSQTLSINYSDDAVYYFSVLATQDTCTEMSAEVFVDGYAFGSPYLITSGNFTTGPNGEALICTGDSLILEFGLPYDTLITWYRNGTPIPNAKGQTYKVTASGAYDVSGAPTVCPNFIQQVGIPVDVIVSTCTGINEHNLAAVNFYPNPANDYLYIDNIIRGKDPVHLRLLGADGKLVLEQNLESEKAKIDLAAINAGIYFCELKSGNEVKVQRVNIIR